MGQNPSLTIYGLTIFSVFNDGDFVPGTQNLSQYNDKINMTDHKNSVLNILVCAPSVLSSLPFNSFFSLNILKASCVEKCMYKFIR